MIASSHGASIKCTYVCVMLVSRFRVVQRHATKQKKIQLQREEGALEAREMITTMRKKFKATMDTFKALAKDRFG